MILQKVFNMKLIFVKNAANIKCVKNVSLNWIGKRINNFHNNIKIIIIFNNIIVLYAYWVSFFNSKVYEKKKIFTAVKNYFFSKKN